jgi:membrane protein YqaA with SNARE-associated domain
MWEILGGLLIGTAVSGIVPLINAELPGVGVPLVVVVSTAGQMSTKTLLYGVARWAPGRLPRKARAVLDRASGAMSSRRGAASSLVFTSAAIGLPPFYGTSLAAGALGIRLRTFVLSGIMGRVLRFGVLACAARYVGQGILP